ncbi:MAG: alpha/beta fold hydrolase [Myxococcales bacterium]|nr:alpha/beta fold hydrolase [Myxococcales bacterium]
MSEDLSLPALDGRPLAATVHEPQGPARAGLVVLSALGVPRRYYAPFAAWMAARGVGVLTFDYRGSGDSRSVPVRRDPSTLLDWARLDAAAAIDHALGRWPGVWGLGHSYGGQALGLTPRGLDLAGAVVVAAGSGDLDLYAPAFRTLFNLRLALLPAVAGVFGYIPGALGLGMDLPAGVLKQWAAWCRTPDYARGALGYEATHHHRITAPVRFYEFTDDTYAPAAPAAALRRWYSNARVTHRRIAPGELGLKQVGHFGAFRPGPTELVWHEVLDAVTGDARRAAPARAPVTPAPV